MSCPDNSSLDSFFLLIMGVNVFRECPTRCYSATVASLSLREASTSLRHSRRVPARRSPCFPSSPTQPHSHADRICNVGGGMRLEPQ